MNTELALKIFTLGVKFGLHQGQLGFEPDKMADEDVHTILYRGILENKEQIEKYEQGLVTEESRVSWYTQHWTAKQSFRFGLLSGFDECEKTKADKKGVKILTENTIDKLTQFHFKACKEWGED